MGDGLFATKDDYPKQMTMTCNNLNLDLDSVAKI